MNIIKNILICYLFISTFFIFSETCNKKQVSENHESHLSPSLELALAHIETNDLLTGVNILNQIIKQKEKEGNYDTEYVRALYEAQSIYFTINDLDTCKQIMEKTERYDKSLPNIRFENGFMIAENMPPGLDSTEGQLIIKTIVSNFGLSMDDVEISGNQMKVKLKCKSCRETPD